MNIEIRKPLNKNEWPFDFLETKAPIGMKRFFDWLQQYELASLSNPEYSGGFLFFDAPFDFQNGVLLKYCLENPATFSYHDPRNSWEKLIFYFTDCVINQHNLFKNCAITDK